MPGAGRRGRTRPGPRRRRTGGEACPALASGPQGHRALRARPESSAGAIGSGARAGKVSRARGVCRSGRRATLRGCGERERTEGENPPPPCASPLRTSWGRVRAPRLAPPAGVRRRASSLNPSRGPRHLSPKGKDFEGKSRSRGSEWRRFHRGRVVARRS